jgi:lipoic acid synthetase
LGYRKMILDLGLIDYEEAWARQKEFVARRKLGEIDDSFILAEHPAVFTVGRAGSLKHIKADKDVLASRGIKVIRVDRGGEITCHSPGQIVLYPIIDLALKDKDLHLYLRCLEDVAIKLLGDYGIGAATVPGRTGVWVDGKKIVSIGIGSSNWVTFHGLSINVNNDLSFFSMIDPCGLSGVEMTSIEGILGRPVDMAQAKKKLVRHAVRAFPKFPPWIRAGVPGGAGDELTRGLIRQLGLGTVCESGRCPNIGECFSEKKASFLILGPSCTRRCSFCSVDKGSPSAVDTGEPGRIAEAVSRLGIKHAVITSVSRDDLDDGGASVFAEVIRKLRALSRPVTVEVLVPDFGGDRGSVKTVLDAGPDIFSHNIETVARLYQDVRKGAGYNRSLEVLKYAKIFRPGVFTKSGLILGLGEREEEIIETIADLRSVSCDMLTIGQYLRPSRSSVAVRRFVAPGEFEKYKRLAGSIGFVSVMSAPFARSSYQAKGLI